MVLIGGLNLSLGVECNLMEKQWFEFWFDSPYYHLLYKNRDPEEAFLFVDALIDYLEPPANSTMLDLACGRGRHAVQLASRGFFVTGLDISPANVNYAMEFANDRVDFYQHDMRNPFRIRYYNFIFNFFTSFGYFTNDRDHEKTILNVFHGLKPKGIFVLDFMNIYQVKSHLIPNETKLLDDVQFDITRQIKDGYITKTIKINNEGQYFDYQEKVRAYSEEDLTQLLLKTGFKIVKIFGDHKLSAFDQETSDRLIYVAEKP